MTYRLMYVLLLAFAVTSMANAFPQSLKNQMKSVKTDSVHSADNKLIKYVNPLIGTDRMGHTYPGATVPFGMVQLSPDTDTIPYEMGGKYNPDVYKYCAGYQYSDSTIVGFSHTHFSGTGHSDLGDILLMPIFGTLQMNPGTAAKPLSGYRSAFSHKSEVASPAYYAVTLKENDLRAELTATSRTGVHRYTFSSAGDAHIILDMIHGIYNYENKDVWTFIRVENDTLITGFRQTNGWARTRTVYFAIAFSKPVKSYGFEDFSPKQVYKGFWRRFDQTKNFPEAAGAKIRGHFDFAVKKGEQIVVRVALSPVSTEGAIANMIAEAPRSDFEIIRKKGEELWEKELSKITVSMQNYDDMVNFYTAMYHAYLSPTLYMDTDGKYKGLDQNIHIAKDFDNYTTFSLWDTYRALHPLFNIIQQKRNASMINSMLAHYDQSVHHMLPVWSHYANENWCMIGYHAVPVIADAIVKNIGGFDYRRALDACTVTASNGWYDGLDDYMSLGYVPDEKSGSSVSVTLEYAFDDWCIAKAAEKLGDNILAGKFSKRGENYLNVFDPKSGFMKPRSAAGLFRKDFDPLSTLNQGFIEGNAWNYSLYVPQDPEELIKLMGGDKLFVQHLDSLFTMYLPDKYFAETEDITRDGIIGNYVHGNEPSHHVAYLYNHAGAPKKTQYWIRYILPRMYKPTPDGLGGNDDCGQMSAWYIFSSLGFYPLAPGSNKYDIGSPNVKTADIKLDNGKVFSIEAVNQSPGNVYIQKATLNGIRLDRSWITHEEIMAGGKLVFYMTR
jgi:predicted alpha-1,2-mannosidase